MRKQFGNTRTVTLQEQLAKPTSPIMNAEAFAAIETCQGGNFYSNGRQVAGQGGGDYRNKLGRPL